MVYIMVSNCAHIDGYGVADSPSTTYTEVSFYSNGQKEYAAEYLNGKLDGTSRQWSEDGTLISESEYSNDKLHGIWKKYYANEKMMYEAIFFHGQKHGKEKWFYENGNEKSEQSFHYGEPSSIIIRWHPDGSILY